MMSPKISADMMSWIAFSTGFVLGLLSALILASILYSRKEFSDEMQPVGKIGKLFKRFLRNFKLRSSVNARLAQIEKIVEKQLELYSAIDSPQKNALDGKYKNTLIQEIDDLEREKVNIMSSILKEGVDPSVVVTDEYGNEYAMKLSEYMANFTYQQDTTTTTTTTTRPETTRSNSSVNSGSSSSRSSSNSGSKGKPQLKLIYGGKHQDTGKDSR